MISRRFFIVLPCLLVLLLSVGCPKDPPDEDIPQEGELDNGDNTFAAIEQRVLTLVNKERKRKKLVELKMDEKLRAVAVAHSEDMAANNYFSHTNLEGLSPFDRMDAAGINWKIAGENLTYNSNGDDPALTAVTSWKNSPEHYENMMTKDYTLTGIGVGLGENGIYFFTQVFVGTKVSQEPVG
jgi:uncharacterized protein YkwD